MDRRKINPLLALVRHKASQEGINAEAIARKLDISESYFSQLTTCSKSMSGVNDNFLRKSADYLGLPPVICFLMAGKLNVSDFFEPSKNFQAHVKTALDVIADSKLAFESTVNSECLQNLPSEVQLMIVLLYEKAFQVELLPKRVRLKQITSTAGPHIPFQWKKEE